MDSSFWLMLAGIAAVNTMGAASPGPAFFVVSRTAVGNFVVDTELITRNFPEGRGVIELLCVYEVREGRICRAQFGNGWQRMLAA